MNSSNKYYEYDSSVDEYNKIIENEQLSEFSKTWCASGSLDSWRHERMRSPIKSVIQSDPDASWLTIGDGRYGTDGNYLMKCGAKFVHCTDISGKLLQIGKDTGFINSFSTENAESISFDDNSFDYVYCKESLHHFPRPYMALYEMFRVARKAVILTEPRDFQCDRSKLQFFYNIFKYIARRSNSDQHNFEPVGNFVYTVSERELSKFMLGMHYRNIAFIGCNDAYIPGVEHVKLGSRKFRDLYIKTIIYIRIIILDFFGIMGICKSSMLMAALFKTAPSEILKSNMEIKGWSFKLLPDNPYRKKN